MQAAIFVTLIVGTLMAMFLGKGLTMIALIGIAYLVYKVE